MTKFHFLRNANKKESWKVSIGSSVVQHQAIDRENRGSNPTSDKTFYFIFIGEPIGTVVTRVNAIDRDGTFPNNQVYYYIKPNSDGAKYFKINSQTGEISTKAVFDRETKGAYALEVEARDGAPSARPNSGGQPNSVTKYIRYVIK